MPDGVIFDMDGVLVDSAAAHLESWRILGRRHGVEISEEGFRTVFGRGGEEVVHLMWGGALSPAEVRTRAGEKEAVYRELIGARVPLMPGVHEVVERLWRAGYRLAVGTSGPPENLDLVLERAGVTRYFSSTVDRHEVEHGKPAPDIFLAAAGRLGVVPARTVVIEDAPVGVEAARRAGMQALGLAGFHDGEALLHAGAARVLEALSDVTPALVAGLLNET